MPQITLYYAVCGIYIIVLIPADQSPIISRSFTARSYASFMYSSKDFSRYSFLPHPISSVSGPEYPVALRFFATHSQLIIPSKGSQ